jgi:hypothetical protein
MTDDLYIGAKDGAIGMTNTKIDKDVISNIAAGLGILVRLDRLTLSTLGHGILHFGVRVLTNYQDNSLMI